MNHTRYERARSAPQLITIGLAHAIADALVLAVHVAHPELLDFDNIPRTTLQRRAVALLDVNRQLQLSLQKYAAAAEREFSEPLNDDDLSF